jgi:hypothetical protein
VALGVRGGGRRTQRIKNHHKGKIIYLIWLLYIACKQ